MDRPKKLCPLWQKSVRRPTHCGTDLTTGTVGRDPVLKPVSFQELAAGHFASLQRLLIEVDVHAVERIVQVLRRARDRRSMVFIAGNGGSASTASHWVNDLGKATKRSGSLPMNVLSLSDNTAWLTALANDEGYDRVFAGQLENFAKPDDVLIVISASGNSPNLVQAVELARDRGVTTVALLGFDGGRLKDLVDQMVWVKSEKGAYELVEDTHAAICHAITRCLIADRLEAA
jgi:D-sedoheptulose 7-phosphate isomerase